MILNAIQFAEFVNSQQTYYIDLSFDTKDNIINAYLF